MKRRRSVPRSFEENIAARLVELYASGVGRGSVGLFWRPALKQLGIFSVHLNELDEAVDAEVSERLDTVFANTIDPDSAVLDLHSIGNVSQPIFIFTEVLRDLGNGGDVMDLVDVGSHAARAEIADARVQFQGRSSFSR